MSASASRRATTEPMTEEQLAEIEARATAAAPGPWTFIDRFTIANTDNNAFIAAARTDVPALVAEIRRLRAALTAPETDAQRAFEVLVEASRSLTFVGETAERPLSEHVQGKIDHTQAAIARLLGWLAPT